jgi:hypothetical protein
MAVICTIPAFARIQQELKAYPASIPLAMSRAVNEAIRKSRTSVNRAVREFYNVKLSDLNRSYRMRFSTPGEDAHGSLISSINRYPLFTFGVVARKTEKVVVSVRQGERTEVEHGFMAIMPSGHVGIFARIGDKRLMRKGNYVGKMKQPIHELFTGAASEMLKAARSENAVSDAAYAALEKAATRQITYWLAKGQADKEEE